MNSSFFTAIVEIVLILAHIIHFVTGAETKEARTVSNIDQTKLHANDRTANNIQHPIISIRNIQRRYVESMIHIILQTISYFLLLLKISEL